VNAPAHSSDETGLAVLATKLDHLSASVDEIKSNLATSGSVHVTRSEWALRNQNVDERFTDVRGDITRIEREMQSRRAPWWSVVAAGAGIAALVWTIFGPAVIAL
jgi:hypothetical protein